MDREPGAIEWRALLAAHLVTELFKHVMLPCCAARMLAGRATLQDVADLAGIFNIIRDAYIEHVGCGTLNENARVLESVQAAYISCLRLAEIGIPVTGAACDRYGAALIIAGPEIDGIDATVAVVAGPVAPPDWRESFMGARHAEK